MSSRLLIAVLACVLAGPAANAPAQERRELVGELLRTLLESQLNRSRAPQPPPAELAPRVDPLARTARAEALAMSADSLLLAQTLQADSRGLPRLRSHLGRLIQVQAALDYWNQSRTPPVVELFARDYAPINRDWRMTEFLLLQAPDLSPRARQQVQAVAQHDRKLCQLLGLAPQLDRTELVRLAGELTTHYRQLLDDVYLDLRRSPQFPALLQQGQQVQLQLRQLAAGCDRAGPEALASECQRAAVEWRKFSGRLHPVATDRIRRGLLRVEQATRSLAEQLWLPLAPDPVLVGQLVSAAEADIQRLLSLIALPELLTHPAPEQLLRAAREFHQGCGVFAAAAQRSQAREALQWDFQLFEVQWRDFAAQCRPLPSPLVRQQLLDVEARLVMLRDALGLDAGIDRTQLLQLAARLDELTFELEETGQRRVLAEGGYSAAFRTQMSQDLATLHRAAHTLHDACSSEHDAAQLQSQALALVTAWNKAKSRAAQCQPKHQDLLYPAFAQGEPHLVNLQVLFSQ